VGNMVSKVVTSHKLEEAYEEGRPWNEMPFLREGMALKRDISFLFATIIFEVSGTQPVSY
jgi:hypothetical protein